MSNEQKTIEHILNEVERERKIVLVCALYENGIDSNDPCIGMGTGEALGALASIKPQKFIELYERGIHSKSHYVRKKTAGTLPALLKTGSDEAISFCLDKIYDDEWPVKEAINPFFSTLAIVRPDRFRKEYLQYCDRLERNYRYGWGVYGERELASSLSALAPLRPNDFVDLYLKGLEDDKICGVVAGTIGALVSVRPNEGLVLCGAGLKHDKEEVRRASATALSSFAAVLPRETIGLYEMALNDDKWYVKIEAVRGLGALASPLPDEFIKLYKKLSQLIGEKLGYGHRMELGKALAEALSALAPLHPDTFVKMYSEEMHRHWTLWATKPLRTFASLMPDETVELCREGLNHKKVYVQSVTAEVLGELVLVKPCDEVVELFEKGLESESVTVKVGTVRSLVGLARVKPANATEFYKRGLEDKRIKVSVEAARRLTALVSTAPDAAAILYEEALRDIREPVRRVAAQGLGVLAMVNPEMFTKLYLIEIRDEKVRKETAGVLGYLAGVKPHTFLALYKEGLRSKYEEVRRGTAASLQYLAENIAATTFPNVLATLEDDAYNFFKGYLESKYFKKNENRGGDVSLLKGLIKDPDRDYSRLRKILEMGLARDLEDIVECAELNISNYLLLRKIGQGALKKVYNGANILDLTEGVKVDDLTDSIVTIKVYIPTIKGEGMLDLRNEEIIDSVRNEFKVRARRVQKLGNPHLNGIIDAFKDPNTGYFVTIEEFCNGGSLLDYDKDIDNGRPIPLERALDYIIQIEKGLYGLRQLGISHHGDLKFQNILVQVEDGKPVLRLCDFGQCPRISLLARISSYANVGYPATMAPELLGNNEVPDFNSDLWSLGSLFYKMLIGDYIIHFKESSDWREMLMQGSKGREEKVDLPYKRKIEKLGQDGIYRKIDDRLNRIEVEPQEKKEDIKDILRGLLVLEPQQRLSYNVLNVYLKKLLMY